MARWSAELIALHRNYAMMHSVNWLLIKTEIVKWVRWVLLTALNELYSVFLEELCEKLSLRVSENNYCQSSEHLVMEKQNCESPLQKHIDTKDILPARAEYSCLLPPFFQSPQHPTGSPVHSRYLLKPSPNWTNSAHCTTKIPHSQSKRRAAPNSVRGQQKQRVTTAGYKDFVCRSVGAFSEVLQPCWPSCLSLPQYSHVQNTILNLIQLTPSWTGPQGWAKISANGTINVLVSSSVKAAAVRSFKLSHIALEVHAGHHQTSLCRLHAGHIWASQLLQAPVQLSKYTGSVTNWNNYLKRGSELCKNLLTGVNLMSLGKPPWRSRTALL